MAETTGIVQQLTIVPGIAMACIWIGPTPTNTELLFVLREPAASAAEGAFANSMVDALTAAAVARREVVAIHGDTSARITALRVGPV
jgi:hypothetical protein